MGIASIEIRQAKKSLVAKNFTNKAGKQKHLTYRHFYKGKYYHCYTYFSHGMSTIAKNSPILRSMVRQLNLDTKKQVVELLRCPMSEAEYIEILIRKGILPK